MDSGKSVFSNKLNDQTTFDNQTIEISIGVSVFLITVYVLETVTIMYFKRMGTKFIEALNGAYNFNQKKASLTIELMSLWILICNSRVYIFVSLVNAICSFKNDFSYYYTVGFILPYYILEYMGKFVPLALFSFITYITAFLAQGSRETMIEEQELEEELESIRNSEGFESLKGSIKDIDELDGLGLESLLKGDQM